MYFMHINVSGRSVLLFNKFIDWRTRCLYTKTWRLGSGSDGGSYSWL